MQEIEVGEYVRLTSGIIDKIIEIKIVSPRMNGNHLYAFRLENYPHIWREYFQIVKHSKNIIDLIEVGDYVNGYRVVNVINEEPCPSGKCVDIDSFRPSEECTIWEEDIKSIVTKEQIAGIEYKI